MESWTEIKIAVNAKDIDRAGDIANVVVPYGIYIEDYTALEQEVQEIAHIDLIDEDLLKKDRSVAYVHIYLEPDVSPNEAVAFCPKGIMQRALSIKLNCSTVPKKIGETIGKSILIRLPLEKSSLFARVGEMITIRRAE